MDATPIQQALARRIRRETYCTESYSIFVATTLVAYASMLTVRADATKPLSRKLVGVVVRNMRENYVRAASLAEQLMSPPPPVALHPQWLADAMEAFHDV